MSCSVMENEVGVIGKIVPEFYFDIIARITPGVIATAPYIWNDITLDPNLLLGGVGLVISYFVGLILDKISDRLLTPSLRKLLFLSTNSVWRNFRHIKDWEIWVWIHTDVSGLKSALLKKMMAERIAIRSIFFTFLIWLVPCLTPSVMVDHWSPLVIASVALILIYAHQKADAAICSHYQRRNQISPTNTGGY